MDYYLAKVTGDQPLGRRNSEGSFYDSWTPGIAARIHANRDRTEAPPSAGNRIRNSVWEQTDSEQERLEFNLHALILLKEL